MEWITTHWTNILAWIGGIVSCATIIVKLTPTKKDDGILAIVIKVLSALSLCNADGSFVGKKEEK